MASAAFKSSSRRGNATPENSNSSTKVPTQRRTRSLSVSAVSRTHLDIPSDFLIKRDNPLFSDEPENADGFSKTARNVATVVNGALISKTSSAGGDRGRAVSRNSDAGSKKAIGRSLSRVDLGRGRHRSVSRGRYVNGTSESEVEQEHVVGSKYRNTSNSNLASSNVKRPNASRNAADMRGRTRSLVSQSNRYPSVEPSNNLAVSSSNLQIPNWEDGISTGSLSEAEEKTIKAVCEQMKSFQGDHLEDDTGTTGIYETVRSEVRRAISDIQNDLESAIRRNNTTAIATADVTDIPPDLVNPGAVELVLDIRREYARKLEESQERARKLRADLAVEEHRGQELSRILKETLPNPKTPTIQRSRLGRRISSERKKMSKRLTDEAMSYFDECVSISTFDSSDFSAPEDPSLNSVGATIAFGCTASFPQESTTSVSASYGPKSFLKDKQESVDHGRGRLMHSCEDSGLTANSSSNEPTIGQASRRDKNTDGGGKSQFSFGHKPTENMGLQQDIRSYIKNFEKDMDKDGINSVIVRSKYFEVNAYELQGRTESLLADRVFLKNRIESGSLHICGGGIAISFSPFASVI